MCSDDKRFVREGRSIREWILDLISENKEVEIKANDVLNSMQCGMPDIHSDMGNVEFDKEAMRFFPAAVKEVFSDPSFPSPEVLIRLSDRSGALPMCWVIMKNAGQRAVGRLVNKLDGLCADDVLAHIAAQALGNMGDTAKSAFDVLWKKICQSPNHVYAKAIADIIKERGALVKKIHGYLHEESRDTIKAAIYVMLHLDTRRGIERLKQLASHENDEIKGLIAAEFDDVGKSNNAVIKILHAIIKNETGHTKSVAIESLAKACDDPDIVVPILIDALGDRDYSFCVYEGCVESAASYLLQYADMSKFREQIESAIPKLIDDLDFSDLDKDDVERIRLLSKLGAKAKQMLPSLKPVLDGFLEYDPDAKEYRTKVLKEAVEEIQKDLKAN